MVSNSRERACTSTANASATTAANYDQNNEIGSIVSPATTATGNTVTNFGGRGYFGLRGIGVNLCRTGLKILANNTVNSTGGTAGTSTLRGIYGNTGTSSNFDVTNNTITLASGATTSSAIGIDNGIGSTARRANTVEHHRQHHPEQHLRQRRYELEPSTASRTTAIGGT